MSELVDDCPRCGTTKITFDLLAYVDVGVQYRWQHWYEAFCVCRHCGQGTIFLVAEKNTNARDVIAKVGLSKIPGTVNQYVRVERYINARDKAAVTPPEHIPEEILAAFKEAAACLSIGCYNAAGTMFRLCVDRATLVLVPSGEADAPPKDVRRSLGKRLVWLFDTGRLPEALRDLSHCIKEDGNDGAHEGTLARADAEDLLDFTNMLLERLYSEPKRLEVARERRAARRDGAGS